MAIMTLWSCKKEQTPPEAPQILNFGIVAADTTITLGSNLHLTPKTTVYNENIYSWELQGKAEATTPDYTFAATKAGVYTLKFTVSNQSGMAEKTVQITVKRFIGGILIVNEGWFGHDQGSVNHLDLESKILTPNIYKNNNVPRELGVTTCYGTEYQQNLYFVSKQGRRLVVADMLSMEDRGSIEQFNGGGDGRAFAGIDDKTGVITTSEGAYILQINPLSGGSEVLLAETKGDQCGGVYATKQHIFVINQEKGLQIFSTGANAVLVKTIPDVSVGIARAKDGSLWAAATTSLIKIDPSTLATQEIQLPEGVKISNSWGAWNKGSLCASQTENALFFTKGGTWGGGREIYRYQIGDIGSLSSVFASSSQPDDAFYGSGIGVDPVSGDIVATFVKDGWGDSYSDNRVVVFDGKTGAEKKRINFDYFWFPAAIMFN